MREEKFLPAGRQEKYKVILTEWNKNLYYRDIKRSVEIIPSLCIKSNWETLYSTIAFTLEFNELL